MSEQNQQQLEQELINSAFVNIAARGALTVFTELRDETAEAGNNLQKTVQMHANELSEQDREEVKRVANDLRNRLISLQAAVDASFAFENITSSEGRHVN